MILRKLKIIKDVILANEFLVATSYGGNRRVGAAGDIEDVFNLYYEVTEVMRNETDNKIDEITSEIEDEGLLKELDQFRKERDE